MTANVDVDDAIQTEVLAAGAESKYKKKELVWLRRAGLKELTIDGKQGYLVDESVVIGVG